MTGNAHNTIQKQALYCSLQHHKARKYRTSWRQSLNLKSILWKSPITTLEHKRIPLASVPPPTADKFACKPNKTQYENLGVRQPRKPCNVLAKTNILILFRIITPTKNIAMSPKAHVVMNLPHQRN